MPDRLASPPAMLPRLRHCGCRKCAGITYQSSMGHQWDRSVRRKALKVAPDYADAMFNFALLLLQRQKQHDRAWGGSVGIDWGSSLLRNLRILALKMSSFIIASASTGSNLPVISPTSLARSVYRPATPNNGTRLQANG